MRRDPGIGVELLADVGASREAHVVGRGEDEDADALVVASGRQVPEHLLEHLRVDRVAGLGPIEPQQGDARLVHVVAGQLGTPSITLARVGSARSAGDLALTQRVRSRRRRAADQLAHLGLGLGEPRQDVGGDDLGIGRVGPPDPGPDAPEVAPAESLGEALQPVVAGDPAAELRCAPRRTAGRSHRGHDDPLQRQLQRPPRRPGGGPGLVHERLGHQDRDLRAARGRRGPR